LIEQAAQEKKKHAEAMSTLIPYGKEAKKKKKGDLEEKDPDFQ
jgi:hypothetical protein